MAYVGPAYGSLAANQAKVNQLFRFPFSISTLLGDAEHLYKDFSYLLVN